MPTTGIDPRSSRLLALCSTRLVDKIHNSSRYETVQIFKNRFSPDLLVICPSGFGGIVIRGLTFQCATRHSQKCHNRSVSSHILLPFETAVYIIGHKQQHAQLFERDKLHISLFSHSTVQPF